MNKPSTTRTASPRAFRDSDGAAISSSMRPRNRRLVSTEQELVITSGRSTPNGSRAGSPIPSKHPSRSATRVGSNARPAGGLLAIDSGGVRATSPAAFGGIWDGGWSTLQGLASSLLGVQDEGESEGNTHGGTLGNRTKRSVPRKPPGTWGPAGLPQIKDPVIGTGTLEERVAALKMRKMRGVLEGREEDLNVPKDTNGNYKRRTSLEETTPDSQDDGDGDALVYIHHVQPQDTLAGVVLRYNCQPEAFRKSNRFWPNDSIQTREVVILPIDACTIKGRPCEPPSPESSYQGVDLLAPTPEVEDPPPFTNGSTWPQSSSIQNETSAERQESEDEHPWVHVRWVLIDSSPSSKPVEIARMPRKTLGYFPPRRRKSQANTSLSTPRASSEIHWSTQAPNGPTISPSSNTSRRTSNLGRLPSQTASGSYFPPPMISSTRPRRESVSEAMGRLGWMRGPGGVGTLGKNVSTPGPAQDGLNIWANKHIPGLAIDSLPSTAILGSESAHFGFGGELGNIARGGLGRGRGGGVVVPAAGSGQGLGLENAAAAIEGWVRRLTIKGPGTPKLSGRAESTNLIELLDGTGSDDGRSFELNPGSLRGQDHSLGSSARDDGDGLTRERVASAAKGAKED